MKQEPHAESSNYETMEESIPSFRSNAITPKPTYDLPVESTPTKVVTKRFGGDESPDGWGDDETPKKQKETVQKTLFAPKVKHPLYELFRILILRPFQNSTPQKSIPGPSSLSNGNLSSDSPTCSIPIIETEHQTPSRTAETPEAVEESPQNVTVLEQKMTPCQTPKKEEPTTTAESTTDSAMIRDVQDKFHDDGWEDEEKKLEEEIQKAQDEKKMREVLGDALKKHKEKKMENLKERIREHFRSTSSAPEATDDVSNKSLCPTASESSEHALIRDGERRIVLSTDNAVAELIDEFANVPEALKQLADSFISSVQKSAMNKNRPHFVSDIFTMEIVSFISLITSSLISIQIALKSSGDLEQRFWKQKIQEARGLDPAFD